MFFSVKPPARKKNNFHRNISVVDVFFVKPRACTKNVFLRNISVVDMRTDCASVLVAARRRGRKLAGEEVGRGGVLLARLPSLGREQKRWTALGVERVARTVVRDVHLHVCPSARAYDLRAPCLDQEVPSLLLHEVGLRNVRPGGHTRSFVARRGVIDRLHTRR